ncbi:hypothetical protein [Massilia sp. LC238]|uniref:hypothetical protein n=1 Tax=Massilia sp. LC238 TaxID=1502852 RepID=UPI0004E3AB14|nr:hypothetical protein [Massilia sp. LC238]KFC61891.1 hypothetical protein FG94_04931 [Massilia sp. LC238]
MTSPFIKHRSKVLGGYGAAQFLESAVLAMYNGQDYKTGLSRLTNLDQDHLAAFLEMAESYARNGENDPAFMELAQECVSRRE